MNRVNEALVTNPRDNRGFRQEDFSALAADLPPPVRLAIGYAPAKARKFWLGLFALDRRFAQIVATAQEPMLAQMRLAWWRETLQGVPAGWPVGDPLLGALKEWSDHGGVLSSLADGWEAMLGEGTLDAASLASLAGARGDAVSAVAHLSGQGSFAGHAYDLGYAWALADIALHLSEPRERETALALWRAATVARPNTPRVLRPVAVLERLCRRTLQKGVAGGGGAFFTALRVGLFGR